MNYVFTEAARAEHLAHVVWYDDRQPGLGARYLAAFVQAMTRICEAPHRLRIEHPPDIRRYRVPGFPFNVLFRERGDCVEVLAVAPHRRKPGYWRGP